MRRRGPFSWNSSRGGPGRAAVVGAFLVAVVFALIGVALSAEWGSTSEASGATGEADAIGGIADEFAPPELTDEYALIVPASVSRGGILEVSVVGSRVSTFQIELVLSYEHVLVGHGWRGAAGYNPRREIWHGLLGIPSTAAPGKAHLRVSLRTRDGASPVVLERTVHVDRQDFLAETIPLNSAMTALRSEEDPRKAEESRTLWELLQTTDLTGRYHTGPFTMPLESLRYTSRYGDRRTYAYNDGGNAGAIHNGVDLAAPTGTPISAPGRGRVRMAMDRILTGGTIVIEHLP
ncbi:MAG: M23 family metallopeptidase, partial [Alkalispirochaeta sp.]